MFFALLIFLAAFMIEGIGTYVSILGLSAMFAYNPVIIGMAVALDVGKVVAVTFLYKAWSKINFLMKTYMTLASIVLIIITSMGVFGFLSAEFQKAIATNHQQDVIINAISDERDRLQSRKTEIDKQIADLPANYVKSRVKLMNEFKDETARINARLVEIDEELPKLKVANIDKSIKIGPILYIAQAFEVTPEIAAKWVILIIIGVFDPLAIALILAGNFIWDSRKQSIVAKQELVEQVEEPSSAPAELVTPKKRKPRLKKVVDDPVKSEPEVVSEPEPEKVHKPRKPRAQKKQEVLVADEVPVREKIERSSLEDIDSKRTDVFEDDESLQPVQIRKIVDSYKADSSNIEPAVKVGGPPTR